MNRTKRFSCHDREENYNILNLNFFNSFCTQKKSDIVVELSRLFLILCSSPCWTLGNVSQGREVKWQAWQVLCSSPRISRICVLRKIIASYTLAPCLLNFLTNGRGRLVSSRVTARLFHIRRGFSQIFEDFLSTRTGTMALLVKSWAFEHDRKFKDTDWAVPQDAGNNRWRNLFLFWHNAHIFRIISSAAFMKNN